MNNEIPDTSDKEAKIAALENSIEVLNRKLMALMSLLSGTEVIVDTGSGINTTIAAIVTLTFTDGKLTKVIFS